jgi:hypothetical protein
VNKPRFLHTAAGDGVLVGVAGQQVELGGLDAGRQLLVRRRTDLRLGPDLEPQPGPSVPMVTVMASIS